MKSLHPHLHFVGLTLACLLLGTSAALAQSAKSPLRVLILSGQNNHDWRETTPKLKTILESAGRFQVEVTEHPERCDTSALAKYDVLVSNWNTFGNAGVTNWPFTTRAAFLDFVRRGKGVVVVHSGSSSFYDWPEYQELAGGSWKLGETGHGPLHSFTVRISKPTHTIATGLTNFTTTDELWHRTGVQPGNEVLATAFSATEQQGSGRDEPVAWVRKFGQGRSFTLLLGHDAKAMESFGFQRLFQRGTAWAATGKVPD